MQQQRVSILDLFLPTPQGTPSGRVRKIKEADGSFSEQELYIVGELGSLLCSIEWREPFVIERSKLDEAEAQHKAALKAQEEAIAAQVQASEQQPLQGVEIPELVDGKASGKVFLDSKGNSNGTLIVEPVQHQQ